MAARRNGKRKRNLRNHAIQLGVDGVLAQRRPMLREKKIACVATDTAQRHKILHDRLHKDCRQAKLQLLPSSVLLGAGYSTTATARVLYPSASYSFRSPMDRCLAKSFFPAGRGSSKNSCTSRTIERNVPKALSVVPGAACETSARLLSSIGTTFPLLSAKIQTKTSPLKQQ